MILAVGKGQDRPENKSKEDQTQCKTHPITKMPGNINIDENGYLRASIEEITEETQSQVDMVEEALTLIQSFDPPGVGARNLTECLLLQLKMLNLQGTLVEKIIESNM